MPTRRSVLCCGPLAIAILSGSTCASTAMSNRIHFPPGSRLGFKRPKDLKPGPPDLRHLMSSDYTFEVSTRDVLRSDEDSDGHIWHKDHRWKLLSEGYLTRGVERRIFKNLRYGRSDDYIGIAVVLRDERWMGQLLIHTKALGQIAQGQIERWSQQINDILESISIRRPLSIQQVLAEHRLRMNTTGLHPRYSDDTLFISLAAPKNDAELMGVHSSYIAVHNLSHRPMFSPAEWQEMTNERVRIYTESKISVSIWKRGDIWWMLEPERDLDTSEPRFVRTLTASGKSRSLKLTTYYSADQRRALTHALLRLSRSVSFLE